MQLLVCSIDPSIPPESVKSVANKLSEILSIKCDFIPEHAGLSPVSAPNLNKFSDSVNGKYIKPETPFVCVAFTKKFIEEDCIFGSSTDQKRVAFVSWSDNMNENLSLALHQLGHFFGIDGHCHREKCIMLPFYIELKLDKARIDDVFCDGCLQTVKTGSCYSGIKVTEQKTNFSNLVFGSRKTSVVQNNPVKPPQESEDVFPDKSTCNPDNRSDYLYRVLLYYRKKRG